MPKAESRPNEEDNPLFYQRNVREENSLLVLRMVYVEHGCGCTQQSPCGLTSQSQFELLISIPSKPLVKTSFAVADTVGTIVQEQLNDEWVADVAVYRTMIG